MANQVFFLSIDNSAEQSKLSISNYFLSFLFLYYNFLFNKYEKSDLYNFNSCNFLSKLLSLPR